MTNNMELWDKVKTTDPDYTKKVTFGRSFTAIDPMYQVMRATEVLGVAGKGWGFELIDKTFLPTDFIALTVRIWVGERGNYIDHIGMCGLYVDNAKKKPDSDCFKKAMTDGITKGLSFFGFSADVFLGKFDDNKYVQAVRVQIETADKLKIKIDGFRVSGELSEFENNQHVKDARYNLPEYLGKELNEYIKAKYESFNSSVD